MIMIMVLHDWWEYPVHGDHDLGTNNSLRRVKTCGAQGTHKQIDKIRCPKFSTRRAWSWTLNLSLISITWVFKVTKSLTLDNFWPPKLPHHWEIFDLAATRPSVLKSSTTSSITLQERRFTRNQQINVWWSPCKRRGSQTNQFIDALIAKLFCRFVRQLCSIRLLWGPWNTFQQGAATTISICLIARAWC